MKKFAAILSLVLCLAFFAACGEIEENTKPVISGFADTYTVKAGEEFDALQGVSAFDKEDGDLTDKIVVSSMPEVEFRGGKAVFSQEGSYDIIYSVTDSGKLKTEEFAALTVTAADAVETLYHTFDFSKSSAEIGRGGWDVTLAGAGAATVNLREGLLYADVTAGGAGAGEVILQKTDFAVEAGASYDVRLYLGATANINVLTAVQNADGVNVDTTFRSVELTDSVQIVTMTFKADTTADNMKIVVYMGGGAGAYGVYLEKAEIYSSTGVENLTEVYKQDFSDAAVMNGVANTAFDEVSVLSLSEGKLKVEIPNYPENREEVWLRSFSVATDLDLKEGSSYRVTASVTATAAQTYYINYENAELAFESRAGQNGGTWAVGGNALSVDFTASKDLENMSFHFQLGKAPAETASNVITIDDLKVEEITSVPDTVKETTRFMPYGENTGYDVFNGSDDTSGKFDGTGRIYTDGGALHYIVSNVGSVDYYNKVIFRLELEEMATYKFVFKAKADKEVKGAFLVNLTNGAYDPIALAFPVLTTEAQEFTVLATRDVLLDNSYDIIYQCGGADNAGKGALHIEISDFRVYKIA